MLPIPHRPTTARAITRCFSLLALLISPLWIAVASAPASLTIDAVRVTNVSDFAFTVSWLTDLPASGQVHYGPTPALGHSQNDDAGAGPYTHHVTLSGLIPATTYYFDVVADGQVDDNGGAHHQLTLPPTGGIQPEADYFWGYVYEADGVTPAAGAIVYVTLEDGDGAGSPGSSAPLSALADAGGVWYVNLAWARSADYSAFFAYTANGSDLAHVEAQAGPVGDVAFAPTLGDSYSPDGARMPIILTFAPRVVIGRQVNDVTLTWQHNVLLISYQVWRHTTPYFTPDTAGAALIANGLPPAGCSQNSGTIACSAAGDVASATRRFYLVRGETVDGLTVDSNQVGAFGFALVAGAP